jgi:hypothetical protein
MEGGTGRSGIDTYIWRRILRTRISECLEEVVVECCCAEAVGCCMMKDSENGPPTESLDTPEWYIALCVNKICGELFF